jgi:uncharacterized protein YndB with AHSA1/START domain
MADIFHDFVIKSPAGPVFRAVSTPAGLDQWWTKRSSGRPEVGVHYELWFGPEYDWRAVVSRSAADKEFELKIVSAHEDWMGTRLGFTLEGSGGVTQVRFHHLGWPKLNDHYRISCYCWAMYLRILKRYIEHGETVPYEQRLDA